MTTCLKLLSIPTLSAITAFVSHAGGTQEKYYSRHDEQKARDCAIDTKPLHSKDVGEMTVHNGAKASIEHVTLHGHFKH